MFQHEERTLDGAKTHVVVDRKGLCGKGNIWELVVLFLTWAWLRLHDVMLDMKVAL